MEGFLQEATDMAKSVAGKINPMLDWVAVRIGGYVDINPENIHTILILAISLWIASYISKGKGIKFWIIGLLIFAGLKYIGM